MNLKQNYLLYLLIIIGVCIIYFKQPPDPIEVKQEAYDKKSDSVKTIIHEREVVEKRTINNVYNNIIKGNEEKIWYSQSDSLRLRFIDSVLGE